MIIKCPECGKEISSEAATCPYCGVQNKQVVEKKSNETKAFIIGLIGLAGFVLFAITRNYFTLGIGIGGIISSIIIAKQKSK